MAFRGRLPQAFETEAVRHVTRSGAHHVGDAHGDEQQQRLRQPVWMQMVSSFVLGKQGQLSTPQSNPKGCPIGEGRPRRWARRAEVITEPTGMSWIMLWQAKTTFSQDSLSACPLSKSPSVATLPA